MGSGGHGGGGWPNAHSSHGFNVEDLFSNLFGVEEETEWGAGTREQLPGSPHPVTTNPEIASSDVRLG
ncbi:hypothetical protein M0813_26430 [Anaeramoeba flamelloides]|uniref:Uncharacterized protein n=1 Tax=Anaeramoeba flamelloides TaxID=1746091 RepID=A0ABQ8XZD0_9EUKA|nr:hypothetical protein M0813_26430 [Anaeramoeba flamelloides]